MTFIEGQRTHNRNDHMKMGEHDVQQEMLLTYNFLLNSPPQQSLLKSHGVMHTSGMSGAAMDNPVLSINVIVSLRILDSNHWNYQLHPWNIH